MSIEDNIKKGGFNGAGMVECPKCNHEFLLELKCTRCGHVWYPRQPQNPEVCPKCKSPYWNKPRKERAKKK